MYGVWNYCPERGILFNELEETVNKSFPFNGLEKDKIYINLQLNIWHLDFGKRVQFAKDMDTLLIDGLKLKYLKADYADVDERYDNAIKEFGEFILQKSQEVKFTKKKAYGICKDLVEKKFAWIIYQRIFEGIPYSDFLAIIEDLESDLSLLQLKGCRVQYTLGLTTNNYTSSKYGCFIKLPENK